MRLVDFDVDEFAAMDDIDFDKEQRSDRRRTRRPHEWWDQDESPHRFRRPKDHRRRPTKQDRHHTTD